MDIKDLKSAQIRYYKNLIIEYLRTSKDAPWKGRQLDKLEGIQQMLLITGVITEEQDAIIIKEAKAEK